MIRLSRTVRRLARPALAVVLVFAQAVAAFGFPVVRTPSGAVKACGCVVACGTTPDCCCTPPPPPPPSAPACPRCVAEAAPEPACPKCQVREAAKPACVYCPPAAPADDGVTWVAAWKAKQCRGEGPGGVMAESPAVPPVVPVMSRPFLAAVAVVLPVDAGVPHFVTNPSDPPPRGL